MVKSMRRTCSDVATRGEDPPTRLGFTVVELLVSLILFTIALALASVVFAGYQSRTAAQRAAQVFAMDLSLARTSAVRGRRVVVVDFDEAGMSYVIREEAGDTLVKREFGRNDDIPLSSLDLQLTGDSLVFDTRGVGDLSGSGSSLGLASFAAGEAIYDVSFNVMGASKVDSR
jgi:type II secretory pathway pseudopilin PulG